MRTFGLIGKKLTHSFSPSFFAKKFEQEGITNAQYLTFPLEDITAFPSLLQEQQDLVGLNVTIPYKTAVIPYLDSIDSAAQEIGAVNTIQFEGGKLKGFNTDVYGFEQSLLPLLKPHHQNALVLGTGGAAKAVVYVLNRLQIPFKYVSRTPSNEQLGYKDLNKKLLADYTIIINTTPLGMYPNIEQAPFIPYTALDAKHLVYDLVYNPIQTLFLAQAKAQGATIKNGLEMLHLQAEKAWKIWNNLDFS